MKKIIILLLALPTICAAQVFVNENGKDIDINSREINFIQIVGTNVGVMKKKIVIAIDYGQVDKVFDQDAVIKDSSGKIVKFNSMIDALNFLEKNGWIFVNNYAVSMPSGGAVYHFLLKKKPTI